MHGPLNVKFEGLGVFYVYSLLWLLLYLFTNFTLSPGCWMLWLHWQRKEKRKVLYFVRCGQYSSELWSVVCCCVPGGSC